MDDKACVSSSSELALSEECVSTPFLSPTISKPHLVSTSHLSEILKHLQNVAPKQRKNEFISVTAKTVATNTEVSSDAATKSVAPPADTSKILSVIGGSAFSNTTTCSWPSMKPSFKLQCFRCLHQNQSADDRKNVLSHVRSCELRYDAFQFSNTSQCSHYEELEKSNKHSKAKQLQTNIRDCYAAQDFLAGSVPQRKMTEPYSELSPSVVINDDILMDTLEPRNLMNSDHCTALLLRNLAELNENNENYPTKACIRHLKLRNRNEEIGSLQHILTHVDSSRPRVRQNKNWWSEEIAELRRVCIKARRQYTRYRRRREDPETWQIRCGQLHEVYRIARHALRNAIREAKKRIEISFSAESEAQPQP